VFVARKSRVPGWNGVCCIRIAMKARWIGILLAATLIAIAPAPRGEVAPGYPIVDLRVELPHQLVDDGRAIHLGSGQADAVRLKRGGALGVVLPLRGARRGQANAQSLERQYLTTYRALAASTDLRLPGCRRSRPGLRTWLSIAGAGELSEAPTSAGLWVTRGVRFFGLVRGEDNDLATAASNRGPVLTGLTDRGRSFVDHVHRAGGLIDVSDASEMTVRDVVEIARRDAVPVVASHAGARRLVDDVRNLTDDEIRDIASTNGVIGVSFGPRRLVRGRPAKLEDVVRHVRAIVKVAGVSHVAIGSEYESGIRPPAELLNASRYQRLAQALERSGMSRSDVRKVLATNALRVLCHPKSQH
jgi:membrane dipeptidase